MVTLHELGDEGYWAATQLDLGRWTRASEMVS
jgi:hypothetical protein